jgi:hypothetical protein
MIHKKEFLDLTKGIPVVNFLNIQLFTQIVTIIFKNDMIFV